jgi:hypothetical protein
MANTPPKINTMADTKSWFMERVCVASDGSP